MTGFGWSQFDLIVIFNTELSHNCQEHDENWAIPCLFFFIFVSSLLFTNVKTCSVPITGFELWISSVGSDRSTYNCPEHYDKLLNGFQKYYWRVFVAQFPTPEDFGSNSIIGN